MSNIRLLLLSFILIGNSYGIKAQRTLQLLSDEQIPVEEAVVTFAPTNKAPSSSHIVRISDAAGKVPIPFTENCYYTIQHISYNVKQGIITEDELTPTVTLTPASILLNDLVVTGSRSTRTIKESPVLTQLIRQTTIQRTGMADLQSVLMREVPGMNFQKVGFGTAIDASGLDARHLLFLIDGERMTGEMSGNLDYQRFNIHGVERIEIVKGASSTLYGSQATGAVINLITKKTTKKLALDYGCRYAQMNEQNYPHPQRDDFFYLYEKHADRPNIQTWLSLGSHLGAWTFQSDLAYRSSDAYHLYQDSHDRKTYQADPSIGLHHDSTVVSSIEHPPLGIEGSESMLISQKIHFDPNDRLQLKLYGSLFFLNLYDLVPDLRFTQSRDFTAGAAMHYRSDPYGTFTVTLHRDAYDRFKRSEMIDERKQVYRSVIIQPRILFQSSYFNNHQLILGLEGYTETLTSDQLTTSFVGEMEKRAISDITLFGQDEYRLSERLTLVGGARLNWNRYYAFNIAPKIAAKLTLNEHHTLRFNYAAGYRSPSLKELFFDWENMELFKIIGNSELLPETNHYFSLSEEYRTRHCYLSANIYVNSFRRKIEGVWKNYDMQQNLNYVNLDNSLLGGVELMAKIDLSTHWTIDASYNFFHQKRDRSGVHLNSSSPHAAMLRLAYGFQKKNYDLLASFSTAYTGKKQFDVQDRIRINNTSVDAYYRAKLPHYFISNLSLSQRFYQRYELILGVENLFDYKAEILGAGITMFNIPVTPGRRAFISLALKL